MNYEVTFDLILDLGRDLIRCGGEVRRVEDTLYRLAEAYDFRACHVWVVPSEIQATFTDPEGVTRTQIRHIKGISNDFDALDKLNALSRRACAEKPAVQELSLRLGMIRAAAPLKPWLTYLGGVLGGWGFALFFGCNLLDSLVAAMASVLVFFLVRRLSRRESNPLILNFAVSFVTELFILLICRFGFGVHMETITIGVVMLLVSGLGVFNGLRDMVHLDTLSGLINLVASVTGAIGIALGMALPMLIFRDWGTLAVSAQDPDPIIQVLSGTVACVGFSIWFKVRGWKLLWCGLGALLTWGVYLVFYRYYPSAFSATFVSSIVCGLYGQIMARVIKCPATIFTTIDILPLVPGASLYYALYGIVTRNTALTSAKSIEMILICFGIVFGFMVVEVVNRFLWRRPSRP